MQGSQKIIDLGRAKAAAIAAKTPHPEQPPLNNWREQLTLKLEQLKEKNQEPLSLAAEAAVDFRDREFIKPVRPLNESEGSSPEKPEYHPLAEKALKKLDRAKSLRLPGGVLSGAAIVDLNPATQPVAATIPKRKRFARNNEESEQIEIRLNQPSLPFEPPLGAPSSSAEDSIQTGLVAAPLTERCRAGLIDGVFVFGCFLIFLLVVLFVPDFAFLSGSSFLGMSIVLFLTSAAYVLLFTAFCHQTLGMAHEELRVVTFRGCPLSLRDSSLRSFGYIISMGCFGLGFLWALFDPERLTWHDKISKTLIVRTPLTTHRSLDD